MKLVLAQPSISRFKWELEVLLTNVKSLTDIEIILLFTESDPSIPPYFTEKYGARCFVYPDERDDKSYIPSVRPWLLWQWLRENSEYEHGQYFYVDADVIFREWPDFAAIDARADRWVGSDCDGYIGLDYILRCRNGQQIAEMMASQCGVTVDQMRGVTGIGAHLVISDPTAAFWERAYRDSNALYEAFASTPTNLQKWTAEMWAQLWGMVREAKNPVSHKELDFCRPTDNIKMWDMVKILHNAGVLDATDMFFKGQYALNTPFGEDFSYVRRDRVSYRYVEAIEKVVR